MKNLVQILKTENERLITEVISLMNKNALSGQSNKAFYIKENGEVDYISFCGNQQFINNTVFYTIDQNECINANDETFWGYEEGTEIQFENLGFQEFIQNSINDFVEKLENEIY